ncbi:hypothetical protein LshimejAT787_0905930 [Lyophyllum shimeji]|uniref:Novel STAND NTPase 1 domain-containing protein n=1 Tax=Lyophyllum shimeji TaxID=47721 RepID=A0A9P3UQ66_LYOSH|nr:hypothetical protein LshimejAT787_0905930 [Lyophyllum shimeji]
MPRVCSLLDHSAYDRNHSLFQPWMPQRKDSLFSLTVNQTAAAAALSHKTHDRTVSALNNAIDTIGIVRDLVPLDLARGVLAAVSGILGLVKNTIVNQDDFANLVGQCHKISLVIWRATSSTPDSSDISPGLQQALSELEASLNGISDAVKQRATKSLGSRVLRATINKDIIAGWQRDLDRFLAAFNTELNITANLKLDELLVAFEECKGNVNTQRGPAILDTLPSKPAIFFGRDDLVRNAVRHLVAHDHVALIGPGGNGKTSIARAVVNDDAISEKFSGRRYFVRYDDMDSSQINLATFLDRIARALGISSSKANTHGLISKALSSSDSLLVLDNAETFLEAEKDSGRIVESIDDFGARPNVFIMLTTRTAGLPPNLKCERLRVPALEESAACEAFQTIYRTPVEPSIVVKLLSSLDFHPLSVNLLAQAAMQNEWSPEQLVDAWERRPAPLLEHGSGKVQSLTVTIQLSLNSPSLRKLGDVALHLLQIIAYLPQGLCEKRVAEIFPSNTEIVQCINALCKSSLTYRKGDFITMLAPIRLYISTKYNDTTPSDIPLLSQVQAYYYTRLRTGTVAEVKELVLSEDINIEHILSRALAKPAVDKQTLHVTYCLVNALTFYKPRWTVLCSVARSAHPQKSALDLLSHLGIYEPARLAKALCLNALGHLLLELGQPAKAMELFDVERDMYLSCGIAARARLRMSNITIGESYYRLGDYLKADAVYQNAIHRRTYVLFKGKEDRWIEAWIKMRWGETKALRGEPGAVDLCLASIKYFRSPGRAVYFLARTAGYAELWAGNYENARRHFETALSRSTEKAGPEDHLEMLVPMADVAFRQEKQSESANFLEQARDRIRRVDHPNDPDAVETSFLIAVHLAVRGDVDGARETIRVHMERFTNSKDVDKNGIRFFYTRTHGFYVAGCIELHGNNPATATDFFSQAVSYCKDVSESRIHAQALGGLGEIAFLKNDTTVAKARFDEAKALCGFMGVRPACLYTHNQYHLLSDMFEGWSLFLDSRLPAAAA